MKDLPKLPTEAFVPEREQRMIGVLYEPETGVIAHVHMTSVEGPGALPEREAFEKEAREHVGRYGRRARVAPQEFAFLHVEPHAYRAGRQYRVDIGNRVLVEIERSGS